MFSLSLFLSFSVIGLYNFYMSLISSLLLLFFFFFFFFFCFFLFFFCKYCCCNDHHYCYCSVIVIARFYFIYNEKHILFAFLLHVIYRIDPFLFSWNFLFLYFILLLLFFPLSFWSHTSYQFLKNRVSSPSRFLHVIYRIATIWFKKKKKIILLPVILRTCFFFLPIFFQGIEFLLFLFILNF